MQSGEHRCWKPLSLAATGGTSTLRVRQQACEGSSSESESQLLARIRCCQTGLTEAPITPPSPLATNLFVPLSSAASHFCDVRSGESEVRIASKATKERGTKKQQASSMGLEGALSKSRPSRCSALP